MTFADPPRTITRPRVGAALHEQDDDGIWHLHVPGADVAPCGHPYRRPRRTPSTVPVVLAAGGVLCKAPECFG